MSSWHVNNLRCQFHWIHLVSGVRNFGIVFRIFSLLTRLFNTSRLHNLKRKISSESIFGITSVDRSEFREILNFRELNSDIELVGKKFASCFWMFSAAASSIYSVLPSHKLKKEITREIYWFSFSKFKHLMKFCCSLAWFVLLWNQRNFKSKIKNIWACSNLQKKLFNMENCENKYSYQEFYKSSSFSKASKVLSSEDCRENWN